MALGFVFVPYWARGHIAPFLAVAIELCARGEQVRFVVGQRYRHTVEAAGVPVLVPAEDHPVWSPLGVAVLERSRLWLARRAAWAAARPLFDELRTAADDLWIVDPHVRRLLPAPGRADEFATVPFWTTWPSTWRSAASGLANAMPELAPGGAAVSGGVRYIGPVVGPIPASDPGVGWERLGRRVLVATSGTVLEPDPEFFGRVVRQLAGTDWTLVLATGRLPVSALGTLPANVQAHQWIPQREVLAHADVFLTHAGMNSVHEALLAGVPMLLAPRSREQRRTARRLRALGVGTTVDGARLPEQAHLLADDTQVRARLARLRHRAISAGGASAAADYVLELADAGHGAHRRRGCASNGNWGSTIG